MEVASAGQYGAHGVGQDELVAFAQCIVFNSYGSGGGVRHHVKYLFRLQAGYEEWVYRQGIINGIAATGVVGHHGNDISAGAGVGMVRALHRR